MPSYLRPMNEIEQTRLRSQINPPNRSNVNSTSHNISSMRSNRFDKLSLKCTVEARSQSFKSSFFFRTHLLWNLLPTNIKETVSSNEFKCKLKHHMWDVILDPH